MQASKTETRDDHRREFLKRLAAVALAGGAIGAGGEAAGAAAPTLRMRRAPAVIPFSRKKLAKLKGRDRAFAETFNEAMRTLDMKRAIAAKGGALSARDKIIINNLTKADMTALSRIMVKVKDLRGGIWDVGDVSGGTIF